MKGITFGVLSIFLFSQAIVAQSKENDIVGKWMSIEGNLMVEVFKVNNIFKAKVLWFNDTDDKSKPYTIRTDEKNPDKALRNRKLLGLEVLHGLTYNVEDQKWEDGKIYDAKSGKTWDACIWMTEDHLLKIRGYWHFEFLGETMKFKRI
jgi:uncharacterized protein (DUF2147 family)